MKKKTHLVSMKRCSLTSKPPRRLRSVLKCFFVAVVTVLITAQSNSEGEDDDRLDAMKCSCLDKERDIEITKTFVINKQCAYCSTNIYVVGNATKVMQICL